MKTNHFVIFKKEKNNSFQNQTINQKINSLRSSSKKNKSPKKLRSSPKIKSETKNQKRANGFNVNLQNEDNLLINDSPINSVITQNSGRWDKEEHVKFLKGLITYGNDWKMVQKIIKTRSSSQSRSHAQKFFLKLKNSIKSAKIGNDQNELYEYIFQKNKNMFDLNDIKFNEEEKKKLLNVIISSINLCDKTKKHNKIRNSSYEYYNAYNIVSKSDNHSFHSDEDEDISENENINNEQFLNNKRKRSDYSNMNNNKNDEDKLNKNNKVFNVVKCVKYKNSEDYTINKNKIENSSLNSNNYINNTKNKTKNKFTIYTNNNKVNNNSNININNLGNNNTINNNSNKNINNQPIAQNLIINQRIYNITNNYNSVNNVNNFDLNNFYILNNNTNTINITLFNNDSSKGIHLSDNCIYNFTDNNIDGSQKKIKYGYEHNDNEDDFSLKENNNNDELSSIEKKDKGFSIRISI